MIVIQIIACMALCYQDLISKLHSLQIFIPNCRQGNTYPSLSFKPQRAQSVPQFSQQFSRIIQRRVAKKRHKNRLYKVQTCCKHCKRWSQKCYGALAFGEGLRVQKYNRLMQMARQHQKRFLLTGQDKYSKISHRDKILLIKRVIFDSVEIKETAQALNINYSTAKTLMRKFKKHGEQLDEEVIVGISRWYDIYCQERSRCGYRAIEGSRSRKNSKKERRGQEEETNEAQGGRGGVVEQPTPIAIFQQVLFRQ